jgi:hypothetical protein
MGATRGGSDRRPITRSRTCWVRIIPGRGLIGVDPRSQGSSTCISADEESDHEIVHGLRLGEAQRAADEALDPGPEIEVRALDLLGMLLSYGVLRRLKMPLVSAPAIRGKFGDAKGLQQLRLSRFKLAKPLTP